MTELVAALFLYTEFEGIRELSGYTYTRKQNASVGRRTNTCDEMCGGAGADVVVGRVTGGTANALVGCEGRGGSPSGAL